MMRGVVLWKAAVFVVDDFFDEGAHFSLRFGRILRPCEKTRLKGRGYMF